MTDVIWVLNTGSSSIKSCLYGAKQEGKRERPLYHLAVDGIGRQLVLQIKDLTGQLIVDRPLPGGGTHDHALDAILDWIFAHAQGFRIVSAGHRVVHGGTIFAEPVFLTPSVTADLQALVPLAPQHQPYNLAAATALEKRLPDLPQVACFDTAFHRSQPAIATTFPLPRALTDRGIRRYGFHGLSYDYIASRLPEYLGDAADGRVVVAHLGHGASMCAMKDRRSVATTMGFSALDGLMMGQRCGRIDAGVILHLLQQEHMSVEAVNRLLYEQSGLLGVSGISDDMRELLASTDPHAREAIELFVYRITQELGSLAATLGGLDALVFTAGIGEHAPAIRARVAEQAAWLGVELDPVANEAGRPRISREDSAVSLWVIPTNEELTIVRNVRELLATSSIQ